MKMIKTASLIKLTALVINMVISSVLFITMSLISSDPFLNPARAMENQMREYASAFDPSSSFTNNWPLSSRMPWSSSMIPTSVASSVPSTTRISVDVSETDDNYSLRACVPGFEKNELKVNVDDSGLLTIEGDRSRNEKSETATTRIQEISYGHFKRTLRLPYDVDTKKSPHASLNNGMLSLNFSKKHTSERARQIKIT